MSATGRVTAGMLMMHSVMMIRIGIARIPIPWVAVVRVIPGIPIPGISPPAHADAHPEIPIVIVNVTPRVRIIIGRPNVDRAGGGNILRAR
jgi:hypothetical protein